MSTDPKNVPTTYRQRREKPPRTSPPAESGGSCIFLLVLGVFVLLIGVVVVVIIGNRSLPGDPLYPSKRLVEQVRISLTTIPSERLELEKTFDRERMLEIHALSEGSGSAAVDFSAALLEANQVSDPAQAQSTDPEVSLVESFPAIWLVGDIQVEVSGDTKVIGDINTGVVITVRGRLLPGGEVVATHIQPREYEIRAPLNSVASNQWLVDGVAVIVLPDTLIRGSPSIGSDVLVKAHMLYNERMAARYIEVLDP